MASVPTSGSAPPPPPVWDARPAGTQAVAYGGFWIRFVAYLIDGFLLGAVGAVLGLVFGISMISSDFDSYDPTINIASFAVGWLYFAMLESSERGATVGKMAMGLRVVTGDGQRLSFLNATGRYFAKILSALFFCIGFIMIGFTERKRGLHDMLANTLVIKVR